MKLIHTVHNYDVRLFVNLINSKQYHSISRLARYISRTGDGHLYIVLMLLLSAMDGIAAVFLQTLLLAFVIERPVYFVLKNGFKRNRPQHALKGYKSLITPSDQFSFPSGHTSAAFMVATISSFFIPMLFFPLLTWALLVAVSRVVLGVHFPTDTLVGMVLGVSVAAYSLTQTGL